jgi:putative iron-regulated protein
MQDGQKGMHTVEYLLFGAENNKTLAQFTDRERQYLKALGQNLKQVSDQLLTSWKAGVKDQPGYRTVMTTAGEASNSTYPTILAAAQEIVAGMLDSISEVATEKLGTPMKEKSNQGLESRFSFNTLSDLLANVTSARNVYFGVKDGITPSSSSLSVYVEQKNPSLDRQIKTEFQQALSALEALPKPLEKSILEDQYAAKFQSAQAALISLQQTIEQKLVPLI